MTINRADWQRRWRAAPDAVLVLPLCATNRRRDHLRPRATLLGRDVRTGGSSPGTVGP